MTQSKTRSTKDISYAWSAQSKGGRAMIRLMENATGRVGLLRRAEGFEEELAEGRTFFDVMVARYGLSLNVVSGDLNQIPKNGPLIIIANHPYGILDGLMMGSIMSQVRGTRFRILANAVFSKSPELNDHLLPISFDETKDAVALNIRSRKLALEYLKNDGAVGVFPGGTVSTANTPFSYPMDPAWRNFTARMIAKSRATILPIYFHGHTSRTFQIASHLHYTLRMGLLLKEFRKRVDKPVSISIGKPISHDELNPLSGDPTGLMEYLRKSTYALSPLPFSPSALGYEFEERYRIEG